MTDTNLGYFTSTFGWLNQATNSPNGIFEITADLDMKGFDLDNVTDVNALGCVNTDCIDKQTGTTTEVQSNLKTLSQVAVNDILTNTEVKTTVNTTPYNLTAEEVVNGVINLDVGAGELIFPTLTDVENYLDNYISQAVGSATIHTMFHLTILNKSGVTVTLTDNVFFVLGASAGKDLLDDKSRTLQFTMRGNAVVCFTLSEQDISALGDQVVQNDLTVTNDATINGELKVDEINSTTGAGSLTIEGTELSATGTDVKVHLGDINGSPPTNTSSVVVEGKTDCLMLVQSDWDGGGPSSTSRFTNSLDNNTYQSCFGIENDGTTSIRTSEVGGGTKDLVFRVNGSHVRATNSDEVNNPTGFATPLLISGADLNIELGPSTQIVYDTTSGVAIGDSATSTNVNSDIVIGKGAVSSTGTNSVGLGSNILANGNDCVCIGNSAQTTFTDSISIGSNCDTTGFKSIGIGADVNAKGTNSVVIGHNSCPLVTNAPNSTIIGAGSAPALTTGNDNVIMGYNSGVSLTGNRHIIIGNDTDVVNAADNSSVIIGDAAVGSEDSVSIGDSAYANQNCISIGNTSDSNGQIDNICIGKFATVTNTGSPTSVENVVIGNNANVNDSNGDSVAIGHGALCTARQAVAVGHGSTVSRTTGGSTGRGVAIGENSTVNSDEGVAIGGGAECDNRSVSIGNISICNDIHTIGIGWNGTVSDSGISIGQSNVIGATQSNLIAIGHNINPTTEVASGFYIPTTTASATGTTMVFNPTTGQIGPTTSSIKFKENVKPLEIDTSKIYNLDPVSFDYKNKDIEPERQFGLIAEQVNEHIKELVVKQGDDVFSVKYDMLCVLLLEELKKLKDKVDALEALHP